MQRSNNNTREYREGEGQQRKEEGVSSLKADGLKEAEVSSRLEEEGTARLGIILRGGRHRAGGRGRSSSSHQSHLSRKSSDE